MAVSKVTRSFPCTVEQLWQIVTDLTHTDWRSDLARVEVLDETRFVEHTKSGYAPASGRDGSRLWKVVPG